MVINVSGYAHALIILSVVTVTLPVNNDAS